MVTEIHLGLTTVRREDNRILIDNFHFEGTAFTPDVVLCLTKDGIELDVPWLAERKETLARKQVWQEFVEQLQLGRISTKVADLIPPAFVAPAGFYEYAMALARGEIKLPGFGKTGRGYLLEALKIWKASQTTS